MRKNWWKLLGACLILYSVVGGFLFEVPRLAILNETVRVLYFHVPMWFTMVFLLLISVFNAILYLAKSSEYRDTISSQFAATGIIFGMLGIITGMVWANYTWGSPWHGDPKQNYAAIALLVYLAYFVLRGSLENEEQRARLSAVYNIFAFAALIPLLFILPRMHDSDSMHPGSGGNPGFNMYDLDNRMRMVFYPAVAGWILFGGWIATLRVRTRLIDQRLSEIEYAKNS